MPAQQQLDKPIWYQGTSDAVYQNIEFIEQNSPKYVVILAGDHIYKMDYSIMLSYHIRKNAKCTVGCIEIPKEEAYRFGIMKIDKDSNIIDFVEKPKENPPIIPGNSTKCLGSMGIYIFDKDYLVKKLKKDAKASKSNHDFGKNIIPEIVKEKSAVAHFFQDSCIKSNKEAKDYWRDVGTVYTYWQSNIELTDVIPEFDMYDNNWPILTYQSQLPPAKFIFNYDGRRGQALDSVVADGCIISGATLVKSIAFTNVRINSHAYIENSVLLPNVEVGQNAKLNKVIVDQDVKIPADLVVGEDPKFDEENFYRTPEGVVLITKDMINRL
jgi:glucose-1-phosphate adenylyltransferase